MCMLCFFRSFVFLFLRLAIDLSHVVYSGILSNLQSFSFMIIVANNWYWRTRIRINSIFERQMDLANALTLTIKYDISSSFN